MRWLRNLFSRTPAAPAGAPPVHGDGADAAPGAAAPAAPRAGWEGFRRASAAGPVAVAVDLALEAGAPVAGLPLLVRLRYPLRAPGADGLTSGGEGDALARIEDAVAAAVAAAGGAYAGRITVAGAREHLCYLTAAADPGALVVGDPALDGYPVERTAEEDAGWGAFREELLPTPRLRRWLDDRRTAEALARRGDPGTAPRPVDHQASFPTAHAREAFAGEAAALGFAPVERRDDGPPPNPFAVDLRRDDPVALAHVHGVAWGLAELATRHGGAYDGWEAAPASRAS